MVPMAIDEQPLRQPEEKTYPPARIYPVNETKFEGFIEPTSDGHAKARKSSGGAAIVIDNGSSNLPFAPAILLANEML